MVTCQECFYTNEKTSEEILAKIERIRANATSNQFGHHFQVIYNDQTTIDYSNCFEHLLYFLNYIAILMKYGSFVLLEKENLKEIYWGFSASPIYRSPKEQFKRFKRFGNIERFENIFIKESLLKIFLPSKPIDLGVFPPELITQLKVYFNE